MYKEIDPKAVLKGIADVKEATKQLEKKAAELPTADDIKDGQKVDFLMKNGDFISAEVFRNMYTHVVVLISGKKGGIFLCKEDIVSIDIHNQ